MKQVVEIRKKSCQWRTAFLLKEKGGDNTFKGLFSLGPSRELKKQTNWEGGTNWVN